MLVGNARTGRAVPSFGQVLSRRRCLCGFGAAVRGRGRGPTVPMGGMRGGFLGKNGEQFRQFRRRLRLAKQFLAVFVEGIVEIAGLLGFLRRLPADLRAGGRREGKEDEGRTGFHGGLLR